LVERLDDFAELSLYVQYDAPVIYRKTQISLETGCGTNSAPHIWGKKYIRQTGDSLLLDFN
jgi:hypothetical protein